MQTQIEPQDWILRELGKGLQKLLCLRLDGQPADDSIAGTLLAWHEAVSTRWYDEAEDTPRFQTAFRELMRCSKHWPAPAHFLDALPRLEEPYKVPETYAPRLESDESRRVGMQHVGDIMRKLGMATQPIEETTEAPAP